MAYQKIKITTGAVALTAATAKTCAMAIPATNVPFKLNRVVVSFDGATSTATPPKVELVRSTQAGAGTSTAYTPTKDDPARAETVQTTGAINYSAEPTVLTSVEQLAIPAYNGVYDKPIQPDLPFIVPGGAGVGIRITAPAAVNAYVTLEGEE